VRITPLGFAPATNDIMLIRDFDLASSECIEAATPFASC